MITAILVDKFGFKKSITIHNMPRFIEIPVVPSLTAFTENDDLMDMSRYDFKRRKFELDNFKKINGEEVALYNEI